MSNLFGWLQNYLNLAKITAVSVPGMIVAFALILVLGPIPCPKDTKACPFCSANLKAPEEPTTSSATITGARIASTSTSDKDHTYSISILAAGTFKAGDRVFITGATVQPGLNGTWSVSATGAPSAAPSDAPKETKSVSIQKCFVDSSNADIGKDAKSSDSAGGTASTTPTNPETPPASDSTAKKKLCLPNVEHLNGTEVGWVTSNTDSRRNPVHAKITHYDINGSTAKVTIEDHFVEGDTATISGATLAPQLNGQWPIQKVAASGNDTKLTIKIGKLNVSSGAVNGAIIDGPVSAKITSVATSGDTVILTTNPGFNTNDLITIDGAVSQPDFNGKWQIASAESLTLTIVTAIREVNGYETGTVTTSAGKSAAKDTVIVSTQKWLSGGDNGQAIVPRIQSFVSQAESATASMRDQPDLNSAINAIGNDCANLPLYISANSRPSPGGGPSSSGGSGNGAGSGKQSAPQYEDEMPADFQTLWSGSNACYADLVALDNWLQSRNAEHQSVATQESSDLSTLSTSLAAAQASGDRLVAADLAAKVQKKREELQNDQSSAKWITQADSYVQSLEGQVKTMQTQLQSQITASSTPTPSAAGAVFQTIQQNILMFLLFSLIIGQILDPIQRGLISFSGPRRDYFEVFNRAYGLTGHGEMRYGDRRLPPWTHPKSYTPNLSAEPEELFSKADHEFRRDMNIYNENYAVGAGLITQNEYRVIRDEYFGQSQITSGLILPLLILSACMGIRFICCSAAAKNVNLAPFFIIVIAFAICSGIALGKPLARLMLNLTFGENREVLKHYMRILESAGSRPLKRTLRVLFWICVAICAFAVVAAFSTDLASWVQKYSGLAPLQFLLVVAPGLLMWSLWVAGLDRMHKYYSELQSRIAGNLLRMESNTEQKFIDLISTVDSRRSLRRNLKKKSAETEALVKFITDFMQKQGNPEDKQE